MRGEKGVDMAQRCSRKQLQSFAVQMQLPCPAVAASSAQAEVPLEKGREFPVGIICRVAFSRAKEGPFVAKEQLGVVFLQHDEDAS